MQVKSQLTQHIQSSELKYVSYHMYTNVLPAISVTQHHMPTLRTVMYYIKTHLPQSASCNNNRLTLGEHATTVSAL